MRSALFKMVQKTFTVLEQAKELLGIDELTERKALEILAAKITLKDLKIYFENFDLSKAKSIDYIAKDFGEMGRGHSAFILRVLAAKAFNNLGKNGLKERKQLNLQEAWSYDQAAKEAIGFQYTLPVSVCRFRSAEINLDLGIIKSFDYAAASAIYGIANYYKRFGQVPEEVASLRTDVENRTLTLPKVREHLVKALEHSNKDLAERLLTR